MAKKAACYSTPARIGLNLLNPNTKQNGVATTGNWVNPTAKANNFLLTASPATAAVVGIVAAAADGAVDTAVTT
jgi:hypothetical protein